MIFLVAFSQCLPLAAAFDDSGCTAGNRACSMSLVSGWAAVDTPHRFADSNPPEHHRRHSSARSRDGQALGSPSCAPDAASTAFRDPWRTLS